ncbi:exosortase E/protease, VPEID-CTERM system [Methylobacter sp.]|uniref:exosortase E/protease, VPEID-CTERM system n=1 Tax=Methylobacter sp. TaxID=2051955 RepID=UPI0012170AE5|nr:exosortase E/protease, VPEID-CTERM system [Methylobacter sp.]TAK62447.1 MAG: exosortase E/protease, VPEID-CTERM system [Methylobacter sp.]
MLKLDALLHLPSKGLLVQRSLFLILLIGVELTLLTVRFDTQSFEGSSYPLLNLLGYSGEFLRFSIGIAGAFVIFSISRLKMTFSPLTQSIQHSAWLNWLFAHVALIFIFYWLTVILFESIPKSALIDTVRVNLAIVGWLLTGICALVSVLFSMTSPSCWRQFIHQQHKTLLASVVAGGLIWILGQVSQQAWQPLANLTFWLSFYSLRMVYPEVVYDVSEKLLGTPSFQVLISPECSGYEGIGLIVVFLSIYIWVTRKELRFPQVYVLFPLGIMAIWLLNALRIVVLIAIGSSFSPEIAAGGFHSNAGWITFVIIGVGLVLLCQKMPLFNSKQIIPDALSHAETSYAAPLLAPFVILLAALLMTSAMTTGFDWLYPLRVILAIVTLWLFRKHYRVYLKNITGTSIAIGFLVFIIWIMLVPTSADANQQFATELFSVSPVLAGTWLLFRFLGATITVPIIEELAFRGYLIAKLVNTQFESVKPGQFTWLSFLVSSLLFGLLHGDWFAGTVAGLFFAFALYRRGELLDSVVAHMTTNLLLAVYVISTGYWALW